MIGPIGPGSVYSGIANPQTASVDRPCRIQGFSVGNPETLARVSRIGKELLPSLDSRWKPNFQYAPCGFDCITSTEA